MRRCSDTSSELGLPLLTIEDEWGPGQIEFTFAPQHGMHAADHALLFRSAIKQICRRLGYHATFMARPAFPDFFASGWHVHQSLSPLDGRRQRFHRTGRSVAPDGTRHAVARWAARARDRGVGVHHADHQRLQALPARLVRSRPVAWAVENRGALLRVIGEPGSPACHVENRVGDPAANPYLYLASQVASGLDGVRRGLAPGEPVEEPYLASAKQRLPASLMEAVAALRDDVFFREAFGEPFVDYFVRLKEFEIGRFLAHVTDWEHREYFEMY